MVHDLLVQFWSNVSGHVLSSVVELVVAVVFSIGGWMLKKEGNAAQALEAKAKNDLVKATVERADRLVHLEVNNIEQEVAKDLREAVKDGKVNRSELLALGEQAFTNVVGQLGEDGMALLKEEASDVESYIHNLIVKHVEIVKTVPKLEKMAGVQPGNSQSPSQPSQAAASA